MSEQLRESLSAAMDGEADAFELRRVLDEATNNDELREQWHRFHVMRDFMRDSMQEYHPQLRDEIHAALNQPEDAEAELAEVVLTESSGTGAPKRGAWLGRIGGTAVAAAVAVVVMVNGGVFDDEQTEFADNEFTTPQLAGVPPRGAAALEPVLYQQATDIDKQRQHALMLHHIQQRAMNQASMTSFVKLATFDSTRPAVNRSAPAAMNGAAAAAEETSARP